MHVLFYSQSKSVNVKSHTIDNREVDESTIKQVEE